MCVCRSVLIRSYLLIFFIKEHIYQQVVELPIYPVWVTGWSSFSTRGFFFFFTNFFSLNINIKLLFSFINFTLRLVFILNFEIFVFSF
jgi:hypothetical protein